MRREFTSPIGLLADAGRLYFSRFGFLASVTLAVYLPAHLLFQAVLHVAEIPSSGILSLVLMQVLDLVLSSLAIPCVVAGLVRGASVGDALRQGRRLWMRTLWNQVKVEITVLLYGALLIVPGIVAMIRLVFVPIVIALEGSEDRPLERSRSLAKGRSWRILFVLLPLGILELGASFLLLSRIGGVEQAPILFAIAQTALAIAGQLATTATLLMYLGLVQPPGIERKSAGNKVRRGHRRS